MMWAESVKREFTERIQFTRNVGKNAPMRSQCVPGSLKRACPDGAIAPIGVIIISAIVCHSV